MPFRSKLPEIDVPEIGFHDLVLNACWQHHTTNRHAVALEDPVSGVVYTYGDVLLETRAVSSALHSLHMRLGDVLVLAVPNCIEYVPLSLAAMQVGGVPSGVNPIALPSELKRQITDSRAKIVVANEDTFGNVCEAVKDLANQVNAVIYVGEVPVNALPNGIAVFGYKQLCSTPPKALPQIALDVHDALCLLPYSSGTTGVPKGVMLTHYGQVAMVLANEHHMQGVLKPYYDNVGVNANLNETVLGFLPFFHIYGFMFMMMILKAGGRIIIMQRFAPDKYLQYIQQYKVKVLQMVPPVAQFLAKHPLVDQFDLSSARVAFSGAAPLSKESELELKQRIKSIKYVAQGYGMTESGMGTHLPMFDGQAGNGGLLVVNAELKVIDPETGRELGEGQDGEVCVRGPTLMKGYWNRPDATAETIDKEGWLHSGDIGHYDRQGYIYIVDRIKELIKVKGLQVAPAELEAYLMTHPSVQDAAVIGVPHATSGEVPRAYIVLRDNVKATQAQLQKFIADQVSPYKQLVGGVQFVNEIPKAASGKILRRLIRDQHKEDTKAKL